MTTTHAIALLARSLVSRALEFWPERIRQRRELLGLPDAALKDIGINRCDAWREARKPFWKP